MRSRVTAPRPRTSQAMIVCHFGFLVLFVPLPPFFCVQSIGLQLVTSRTACPPATDGLEGGRCSKKRGFGLAACEVIYHLCD